MVVSRLFVRYGHSLGPSSCRQICMRNSCVRGHRFAPVMDGLQARSASTLVNERNRLTAVIEDGQWALGRPLAGQMTWWRGKKQKKKKGGAAVGRPSEGNDGLSEDDEDALLETASLEALDLAIVEDQMQKTLSHCRNELQKVRSGRPDPSMLDSVKVDAYGAQTPLNSVAQVTLKGPKLLTVHVFDNNLASAVHHAIEQAGLNLNPQMEGNVVNVPIPKSTKESREASARLCRDIHEKHKISLNNVRRGAMDLVEDFKKAKLVSEDELFRLKTEVDALTEKHQNDLKKMCEEREKEVVREK